MIRCSNPKCGRPEPICRRLSSESVVHPDGTVVTTRVTECSPIPDGCGTTRKQEETRRVRDLGVTCKRYVQATRRRTTAA